jgi:hypothetical protein
LTDIQRAQRAAQQVADAAQRGRSVSFGTFLFGTSRWFLGTILLGDFGPNATHAIATMVSYQLLLLKLSCQHSAKIATAYDEENRRELSRQRLTNEPMTALGHFTTRNEQVLHTVMLAVQNNREQEIRDHVNRIAAQGAGGRGAGGRGQGAGGRGQDRRDQAPYNPPRGGGGGGGGKGKGNKGKGKGKGKSSPFPHSCEYCETISPPDKIRQNKIRTKYPIQNPATQVF